MADSKEFFGDEAVEEVQKLFPDIPLNDVQKHVIRKEGYVAGEYTDVGKVAKGVGQTGEFVDKTFLDTFAEKEDLARRLIPDYDSLSLDLQKAIMSGVYRGDLSGSPKTLDFINQGQWGLAADEFLDNNEYRDASTPKGVKKRMEEIARTFKNRSFANDTVKEFTAPRGNPTRERQMLARALQNG